MDNVHDSQDDEYDEEDVLGLGTGGNGEIDLNSMEQQLKNMLNFQAR